MKNGLYSIHIHMLDGVKGRDSGVLILRDGVLIGGGPSFWSTGGDTVRARAWEGHLTANHHSPFSGPFAPPVFVREEAFQRVARGVYAGPGRDIRTDIA